MRTSSITSPVADLNYRRLNNDLALYKRYLDAWGKITTLLLEDLTDYNWASVLKLLAETAQSNHCALFFNEHDDSFRTIAKLRYTWSAETSTSLLTDYAFREIAYEDYPLLSDTLHVGMVLTKNLVELPAAEFSLFHTRDINSVLCIPLLLSGELEGFISFFSSHEKRNLGPIEIDVLCAIASGLALALSRHRVQRTLKASEMRLRALVGATEDIVIEYDNKGLVINVWMDKPGLGLHSPDNTTIGAQLVDVLPPNVARPLLDAIPKLLDGGAVAETVEFNLSTATDEQYFLGRLQTVPSESGHAHHIVALIRDITLLMQKEVQRQTMLETLNLLEEAVIDITPQGKLVAVSSAWNKLLGEPAGSDFTNHTLQEYVHEEDKSNLSSVLGILALGVKQSFAVRFRFLQKTGKYIWVEARLLASPSSLGHITSLRGILRDITSAYLQEKRITEMALHDALTQLPNRILLEDQLQRAIARSQRNHSKVALGFIDIDHFKQINDTLGHKAGDTVLLELSRRLQAVLRDADILSRWGGDEFVVLLADTKEDADFRAVAGRLREATKQTLNLDGIETKITLSMGFAIFPDDADNADTLMSQADHTMFRAKSMGRNNVQFFRDIHDTALDRQKVILQARLGLAVQEELLQIFFQPVIDARNGQVVTFEALARWHDEEQGWIPPDIFIPMAEHLGLIHDIGDQVLEQTLRHLRNWRDLGYSARAAINVSRAQLFAPGFVKNLVTRLSSFNLVPQDLILEITESVALLDVAYESKRLNELSEVGLGIAIDDFGTGYSALAQLHQMPVDILKIDGSFTARLHMEDGRRIMQAIVQMADGLNLETIVEGVEQGADLRFLNSLGVFYMQGFYFNDPVPAGMCETLLAKGLKEKIFD